MAERKINFAHYDAFDRAAEKVAKEMQGFLERMDKAKRPLKFAHYQAFEDAAKIVDKQVAALRKLLDPN